MKQLSFAQAEFAAKKKVTRREQFLAEMEQVVPWTAGGPLFRLRAVGRFSGV